MILTYSDTIPISISPPSPYVQVEPLYTIRNVKCLIQTMLSTGKGQGMGYLPAQQRLIFAGGQLEDERTLQSYNIQNRFTLDLAIRTRPLQVNGQQPPPPQQLSPPQSPPQSSQQQQQQQQQQYPPSPPAEMLHATGTYSAPVPSDHQASQSSQRNHRTKGTAATTTTMMVPPHSLYVKNLPYGAPEHGASRGGRERGAHIPMQRY